MAKLFKTIILGCIALCSLLFVLSIILYIIYSILLVS